MLEIKKGVADQLAAQSLGGKILQYVYLLKILLYLLCA